jgi:hypothetical protein
MMCSFHQAPDFFMPVRKVICMAFKAPIPCQCHKSPTIQAAEKLRLEFKGITLKGG